MFLILIFPLLARAEVVSSSQDLSYENRAQIEKLNRNVIELTDELSLMKERQDILEERSKISVEEVNLKNDLADKMAKIAVEKEGFYNNAIDILRTDIYIVGGALFLLLIIFGVWKNGELASAKREIEADLDGHKDLLKRESELAVKSIALEMRAKVDADTKEAIKNFFLDEQGKYMEIIRKLEALEANDYRIADLERKMSDFSPEEDLLAKRKRAALMRMTEEYARKPAIPVLEKDSTPSDKNKDPFSK